MKYRTKTAATKAFNAGHFEDLFHDVRIYGTIIKDDQWEDDRGYLREMSFNWHGKGWKYTRLNGEIIESGMYESPLIVGIMGDVVTIEDNERDKRIVAYKQQ